MERAVLDVSEPAIQELVQQAEVAARDESIACTPSDSLFLQANGRVDERNTAQAFHNAVLADRFIITDYIQSGQFGRGWRAKDRAHPESPEVFIKTIRSQSDRLGSGAAINHQTHERLARKEIEVFLERGFGRLGAHPNIVTTVLCYGSVAVPSNGATGNAFFFLSPDLCNGGELFEYLCFQRREPPFVRNFEEKTARRLFSQLVAGVQHLHHSGLFHRDLKLENLVLDSRFVLKITDFGTAKWAHECPTVTDAAGQQHVVARTVTGTLAFHPPELRRSGAFYQPDKFDVWCCGAILFFLVAMETMVRRRINFNVFQLIKQRAQGYGDLLKSEPRGPDGVPQNVRFWVTFQEVAQSITPQLQHLLNSIFDINVPKRASIDAVAAHGWLQGEMATDEEYFQDMQSRPTTATGRDRVLDLPEHLHGDTAQALDAVEQYLERTLDLVLPDNDEKSLLRDGATFLLGTPNLFSVEFTGTALRCVWLRGSLEDWLGFVFELKAQLQLL
ncbi:serine/threonine protein kinase [Salpingoeca rosetta]|uniref:Serine/threonine protein kinase n=1 Tax=Salpingoeca rosetta (strain ATCC 50818 / BSB-021) TaxID=946362 RepID=F2UDV6_SALR5|nr:serine/threonine protein kinase [Salpingoeca rosetta]EGD74806.1 serine/threonine protein kinase [Salpingoeca rosetta]|eukprot:XP_004992451.1 serine/threonine protein kinase [Salpingoeca rosetta]